MKSLSVRVLVLCSLGTLCLALLVGCGSGTSAQPGSGSPAGPDAKTGTLSLRIAWPNAEVGARLIPWGTTKLEISVGNSDNVVPEANLVIDRSDVVAGTVEREIAVTAHPEKIISVNAVDDQKRLLAAATITVEVLEGKRTPVQLQLAATSVPFPVVMASVAPDITMPGGSVTLTGTAVDGDGGPIAKYEWDADGDGTYEHTSTTSGTVTVSPPDGVYTATFRATDSDGLTATASVGYEVGTKSPSFVAAPQAVEFPRRGVSEIQTIEILPGFPASPCTILVSPATLLWQPEPSAGTEPVPTFFNGRFACTDNQFSGVILATLKLRDGNGRESDPFEVRVDVKEGFHGFVSTLFDPTSPVASASVHFGTTTTTSDATGEYLVHGVSAGIERMDVSGSAILTRSFPVDIGWNVHQDVTAIPSGYNSYMLRRFLPAPFGAADNYVPGVVARWAPAPAEPPTFVIYTKYLDAETDVSANMISIMRGVVENELPVLTDGQLGGPGSVEIFQGRPHDDPRFNGDDVQFGTINGHNALSMTVVQDFNDAGVGGLGGWIYDGNYWATGGGISILFNQEYPSIIRHELGHALFCWPHPWERMPEAEIPLHIEPSVMNYGLAAAWPSPDGNYTSADRDAIRFCYHRGAGNLEPDRDPDATVGYRATGGPFYGTLNFDPPLIGRPTQTFPTRDFRIENGRTVWLP